MASASMQSFLTRQNQAVGDFYPGQPMTFAYIIIGDVETQATLDYSPVDFE